MLLSTMHLETKSKIYILVYLRWIAFFGIAIVLTAASLLSIPSQSMMGSIFLLVLHGGFNLGLIYFAKSFQESTQEIIVFSYLLMDVVILTFLLKLNGASQNPFSILYLCLASVAVMFLSLRLLLMILITILLGLAFVYVDLFSEAISHQHHSYPFHLQGMWLANSIAVVLISLWIYYLRRNNERMVAHHEKTQKILYQIEKIESMGRVVAQAAHQLNTPLGTLQLGMSELQDQTNPLSETERLFWYQDMQHAVLQIKNIVVQIRPEHETRGENTRGLPTPLHTFVQQWVQRWAQPRKQRVDYQFPNQDIKIEAQHLENIGNILTALLDNAYEACEDSAKAIQVMIANEEDYVCMSVVDQGKGMDATSCKQALEPLYTTKAKGTGLGLYLCQQLAKKYSGYVEVNSLLGKGTSVKVFLLSSML